MPKNTSTSTTSNSYSLRSKGSIEKIDAPTPTPSLCMKKTRIAKIKQHEATRSKAFDTLDDDCLITEQIAQEWIARDNAPASESTIHFIPEDQAIAEPTREEKKKMLALWREAVQSNQHSRFFQMLEYQKRQEHLQTTIDKLTVRVNKIDKTLKQLHKDRLSQPLTFFSASPLLADMEPRLSEDLEAPDNFSLSSNEMW